MMLLTSPEFRRTDLEPHVLAFFTRLRLRTFAHELLQRVVSYLMAQPSL
jgi:hypothetical protein